MKRLAGGEEPVVIVPLIVVVVEVQIALIVVPVEHGHEQVSIIVAPTGACLYKTPSVAPPLEYSWG